MDSGEQSVIRLNKKILLLTTLSFLGFLFFLFLWSFPIERARQRVERTDKFISFIVPWEEVEYFASEQDPTRVKQLLGELYHRGFSVVKASLDLNDSIIEEIRLQGFRVLWTLDDSIVWKTLDEKFKQGDGLVLNGERFLDQPYYPYKLSQLLNERKGFLPLFEFANLGSSRSFYRMNSLLVVKAHALGAREVKQPAQSIWKARLLRAARERWVQAFCISFSPQLSLAQNLEFIDQMTQKMKSAGFQIGVIRPFPFWIPNEGRYNKIKSLLILVISVLAPIFSFHMVVLCKHRSVFLAFLAACFCSLAAGVVLHSLGSSPERFLGITPIHGVKIQLLLPLLVSLMFLLHPEEINQLLNISLRPKHFLWVGGLGFFLIGVYLMRSGNFPLIPVSETERLIRDQLENFLGARPRFKEFFLGHPFLILGLNLSGKSNNSSSFLEDGRLFVLVGMLGQISIVNTFLHFHTPLSLSLLRTFHGIWLGGLFSLILILFARMVWPQRSSIKQEST